MYPLIWVMHMGIIFTFILGYASFSLGDHPNEGKLNITQLMIEAEENSLELKQAQEELNFLREKSKSLYSRFLPKLSIEGGPQLLKVDDEKLQGMSFYGRAEWNIYNRGVDKVALQQQEYETVIQEKNLHLLKNKIRRQVLNIYIDIQFLLESISLKQKSFEMNQQQMAIAKTKNSSGFTSSSDVIEFLLRESIISSDLVLLNQKLKQKSLELELVLGRKHEGELLAVRGHLEREDIKFDRKELVNKINANNDQILLSKLEIKKEEVEKRKIISKFLPQLNFEGRYGKIANEEKVFQENNNYSLLLKFSFPLFSGLEDHYFLSAVHAKILSKQIAMEKKSMQLMVELDASLDQINALNRSLDLEEKNLKLSERYFQLTLGEYKRGIKNSPDMVGASERLFDTKIRNLEYRRDLMVSKIKIQELVSSEIFF